MESLGESVMSAIHNFQEQLAFSEAQSDLPMWKQVYQKAFPSMINMSCIRKDGWGQRSGIDRVLTLECGKTLLVDEKVRKKDWPDFALEYWSNKEREVRGWVAKDLACDYIAYAFLPSKKCYLLPFQQLRTAWRKHHQEWVDNYKRVDARNEGYTTRSVGVPIDVVLSAISESLIVVWD